MDINFGDMQRELEALQETYAQELWNVEEEERELREKHELIGITQAENHRLESLVNESLYQASVLSHSGTAGQVLENVTKFEEEFRKFDAILAEHQKVMEKFYGELQETLKISARVKDVDQHASVEKITENLGKLAIERETELEHLKDEKEKLQQEMAHVEKENSLEINKLLDQYNKLHAKLMKKKFAAAKHSDDDDE